LAELLQNLDKMQWEPTKNSGMAAACHGGESQSPPRRAAPMRMQLAHRHCSHGSGAAM